MWDGNQQVIADVIDNQFYEADCYIRGTNLVAKYNFWNGKKSAYTYYTQNAHGDVVNLTDKDGKVTKSYRYDAFGVEKNIDKNDTNAFRYCGEYFDKETATVYLRARNYNPSTGRFISRDSYAGNLHDPLSLNLYTYCANNPLFYVDPSGHFWTELWEGTKEVAKNVGNFLLSAAKNTGKELSDNSTGFAVAGSMAAADGPAPFGDTAGLLTVIGIIAVSAVKGVYDTATTFEWTDYSSQTKSVPKEEAESKTQTKFATPKKKPNQSVYLLFDENTNQIEYVGRTYNLDVRAAQHSSRLSPRNHLTMIPIAENISYEAARGLEQKGIEKYHTLNNRFLPGGNAYNNQINGISIFNPNYSTYMTAAVPY